MSFRRSTMFIVLAALLCGLAYGVGWADRHGGLPWAERAAAEEATSERPDTVRPAPDPTPTKRTPQPKPTPAPDPTPAPKLLQPGPVLYGPGDSGDAVRDLQARLKQIDWFHEDVTGFYGDVTTAAVRGFQEKRGFPVTGDVDQRTLDRLHAMTRTPTQAELTNQPPPGSGGNTPGALDARCLTGRAMCVDKSSRTLRWVVAGRVLKTVDVRFGSQELPTDEGAFTVQRKSPNHVSSIYHTSMPFAMFFSGGQAVHYSPDFAANGYDGASHGCVNVRDYGAIAWIYDQVQLGDKVIVYWS